WQPFSSLSGVALPVRVVAGLLPHRVSFEEDLLFTHRGLSGPAALQASTYWRPGEALCIDLAPQTGLARALRDAKATRRSVAAVVTDHVPRRLAEAWLARRPELGRAATDVRDRDLDALAAGLHRWTIVPDGTEGFRKAEVTAGGVDTRDLDSRSGESGLVPGLHFIGEVVDVTGWLGGYNFQWAWASAAACAGALA
ncbi:MAG: NAD(P)/FAD-dependent oxidoreductase, partial [Caldimonas sp.]